MHTKNPQVRRVHKARAALIHEKAPTVAPANCLLQGSQQCLSGQHTAHTRQHALPVMTYNTAHKIHVTRTGTPNILQTNQDTHQGAQSTTHTKALQCCCLRPGMLKAPTNNMCKRKLSLCNTPSLLFKLTSTCRPATLSRVPVAAQRA